MSESIFCSVIHRARTKVIHDWNIKCMSNFGNLFELRFFSKAYKFKIRPMRAHNECGGFDLCFFLISQMDFFPGAYFHKICTGLLHYIWYAEASAAFPKL